MDGDIFMCNSNTYSKVHIYIWTQANFGLKCTLWALMGILIKIGVKVKELQLSALICTSSLF